MLASQRAEFEIPREVAYFNAASWSPLPRAVAEAGHEGVERKRRPWTLAPDLAATEAARARRAAAALIGADPEDIAIIPSVAYGVAVAGKLFTPPRGSRVLVIEDDHSSPILEWQSRAAEGGYVVETVKMPEDGDWTRAMLEAIGRKGAPPVGLASISNLHWSQGGVLDLDRIAPALRAAGAALLVDATQAAAVMDLDVGRLDPDFMVFPTYKWTLGPYGRAFLYVAKRRQDGIPLEQTMAGRRAIVAERTPYFADTRYVDGGKRFDMAERDHLVTLGMASAAMELVASWGRAAIEARLRMLTDRIAEGLAGDRRVALLPRALRVPHIICLAFPGGMPDRLADRLAAHGVHAAPRIGRLRISPHVYNDEEDVERLLGALRAELG